MTSLEVFENDFVKKFKDYKDKEEKVMENGTELDLDELTENAVSLLNEMKGYFNRHIRDSIYITQNY